MFSDLICPYPGLRPFTEEESIFFKGREVHIDQIVSQLQEKKFIMITGASGDGKSSLVYAGVIPNARAGFFKAKFNNWIIADFRPERSPLNNFATALSQQLNLPAEEVANELGYGFSSLVELYKSSSYYLDTESETYKNAEPEDRKKFQKKAANLLIIVDQFEEFFTNPENYTQGTVSIESHTVLNVLLETARLSIEQQLPVYIICTMRSDYIGQCAAFRGLPEYIGYSQFFVPRLKRKEIHQVIFEPAVLNGNLISQRLVETLINQLGDGIDQLPVLQQALHQIWKKAVETHSEMDLIHLAMVFGIPEAFLPQDDKANFGQWKDALPEFKKKYLNNPSLGNVLDSHANELYESAYNYYYEKSGPLSYRISEGEVALIIKTAFQSLTKIDDNRAVRNRMTLQEITDMLQNPALSTEVVGMVLNIFREQGNTFLRPFITDNPETYFLKPDSVLDITHEALIRNWVLLREWSNEEYENFQIFQDFKKQLERWNDSSRSKAHLLSLGSLTFFENWYNTSKPTKYWLAKYDEAAVKPSEKINTAEQVIKDVQLFLSESRKAITRKRKTLIASAATFVLLLTCLSLWALVEKRKAETQKDIAITKTREALQSKEEAIGAKNLALTERAKAKQSEKLAISAKDEALQAKDAAEKANEEALQAKAIAEREALKASEQSTLAKEQAIKAENQRKIAQDAKEKAEKAEQRAKALSQISTAQNLALKSIVMKYNSQLQGLLALQAFIINKKNNGHPADPVIFEGLRNAYTTLDTTNPGVYTGAKGEVRVMYLSGNTLISADKQGNLINWDVTKRKVGSSTKLRYKSPITTLFIAPDGKYLVTGHENSRICIWDIKSGKNNYIELPVNSVLKAVAFIDNQTFATGGTNLDLWKITNEQAVQLKSIPVGATVRTLVSDGASIYMGTDDGVVSRYDIKSDKSDVLFTSRTSRSLSITLNKKENALAIGFSDGKVRIFDLNKNSFQEFQAHNTAVDHILYKKEGSLLITAGADKTIKVFENGKFEQNPLVIRDHHSKVRSILISENNNIFAGCADNTIRMWEIDLEGIADKICPLLNRNMTIEEWDKYVGKEIKYQKTCTNIQTTIE